MARTIAVAMRKGGSGKTTTSVNLAAALAQRGRRVLLVDLDPQANATIAVGLNPLDMQYHMGRLLEDNSIDASAAPAKVDFGPDDLQMYVLTSHFELSKVENGMGPADVHVLKEMLAPLDKLFDYIVIDTPPSESPLTVSALVAADEVIVAMQAHYFALEGLDLAMGQIEKIKKGLNRKVKVVGILPTLVNARTNLGREIISEAKRKYGDLVYPMSVEYSIKHPDATVEGVPMVFYDPNHQGAAVYNELARIIDGN